MQLDAHLVTYVRHVLRNYIKEDFSFLIRPDGRAASLEVLDTMNRFLQQNETNRQKCRTRDIVKKESPSCYLMTLYASQTRHQCLKVCRVINPFVAANL